MATLIILVNLFAISIMVLSFIDLEISVAVYVAYLILVPGLQIHIGGISFSYNVVNSLLLIVFLYNFYKRNRGKLDFEMIIPFLFLFISLLFLSIFTTETPWSWQFDYWRGNFMQTCILSFIIWNLGIKDQKIFRYLKWALVVAIIISGIYGIYLTGLGGSNPYTSKLAEYFGSHDAADNYSAFNDPRLKFSTAEKIQSTMIHPMTWALILCFTLVVMVILLYKNKQKLYWIVLALILFNILISGVRTAIAAIVLGAAYFLMRYRQFKLVLVSVFVIIGVSFVVQSNKNLSNLFTSFVDVSGNRSNVSGSSIAMRLTQLNGAVDEMEGNEFFGKGYEWTSYYMTRYGDHPVLLDFESLVFVVLCNSGILGVIVWVIFFMLLFRMHRRFLSSGFDLYIIDSFVIIYLAYAIGTGEYGYLKFFAIFYAYLLSYLRMNQDAGDLLFATEKKKHAFSTKSRY